MSRLGHKLTSFLLFLQSGLIVSGGAVRVTGSGLGCPTWPECTAGSLTPTPVQAEGALHSWIEFGNRLLTFVLLFVAIATFIFVLKNRRTDLYRLAAFQILGTLGQGVLGGITVLTNLNPIPVAGHFLLSIALIAGAASLQAKEGHLVGVSISRITRRTAQAIVFLTLLVITMGTVVTGAGPHAGDAKAPRNGFDTRIVALIHADMVIALIFLTIALLIAIRLAEVDESKVVMARATYLFLAIALLQGLIGYVQYFTGLPELIVAAHLLGATLVWLSVWRIAIKGKVFKR